jgi:hypothetical protein
MAIDELHGFASSSEPAYLAASEVHNEPSWLMHPGRNTGSQVSIV